MRHRRGPPIRRAKEETFRGHNLLPDPLRQALPLRAHRNDRALRREGREKPTLLRLHPRDAHAKTVQLSRTHRA